MSGYDVIIVGAGASGCVLAARLSEDSARRVLLLEAGPDYANVQSLPEDIANSHFTAHSHDWPGYVSCSDLHGHQMWLPRARIVGGCSATNAACALRGSAAVYDHWALLGNPGWSFADVLPYFRRVEIDLDFDTPWHGKRGLLPIRRYPSAELMPVQRAFLEACVTAGYAWVNDHNAPGAVGAGPWPMNVVEGIRQSAALTYLASARGRPNLTIRSGVLVDCVLFDGSTAMGVRLAALNETIPARHIVLAAGTYSSPAILMRSGIGPAAHLQEMGIDVVLDRPGVGQHLSDHPAFALQFAAVAPAPSGSVPFIQTLLTLQSQSTAKRHGHDLHLIPGSVLVPDPWQSPTGATFTLVVALIKPHSLGRLHLPSSDPAAVPVIDMGYFTDPYDIPRLIEGVRKARRIARTPPLNAWVRDELVPGNTIVDDGEDLKTAIVAGIASYHHPTGTCHMGPVTDEMAVVDAQGRVHGVERLWTIDASIMPTIPDANTNLPTMMVAERCVDWLRDAC
jgi:choline dehydrogenase